MKALALVRSQKVEESLVLCDEVLAAKPADESVLNAMSHVLRGLGRRTSYYNIHTELKISNFGLHTRLGHHCYV